MNRFTDGLGNPGDLDGDGLLSDEDLALLTKLVGILEVIEVDIDVLPGSEENPVNPSRKGVIPVAILGSDAFDVETIDLETLRFGPAGASPAHATGGHFEDVNEDGVIDLVSHYPMQETGIVAGLEEACVTAATIEGQAVKGCDRIRIIGR